MACGTWKIDEIDERGGELARSTTRPASSEDRGLTTGSAQSRDVVRARGGSVAGVLASTCGISESNNSAHLYTCPHRRRLRQKRSDMDR